MPTRRLHLLLTLLTCLALSLEAAAQRGGSETNADRLDRLAQRLSLPGLPPPSTSTLPATAPDSEITSDRYSDNQPIHSRPPGKHSSAGVTGVSGAGPTAAGSWWLQTGAALGAVIGLILLLRAAMARLSGRTGQPVASRSSPVLEVLARVNVGTRSNVLLIRLGQRLLVVGESSSGLQPLANIEHDQEIAQLLATLSSTRPGSISHGFTQLLGRFHREYSDTQPPEDDGGVNRPAVTDRTADGVAHLLSRVRQLSRGGMQK